jgi:hypothetical protein
MEIKLHMVIKSKIKVVHNTSIKYYENDQK